MDTIEIGYQARTENILREKINKLWETTKFKTDVSMPLPIVTSNDEVSSLSQIVIADYLLYMAEGTHGAMGVLTW
jgi:hypothetical protein